ncbi:hypothetical protein Cgig2_002455 [Carnegiea gigantea]|uniref:MINDY deubiquitinase domain-containing protein n=1 Tax=Carnegiea gigantea TaxID=171969 RepID=A0A9Q1QNJ4_9CARY|nr:hypothetical protein Cgig2_002455 [Carnegiea gigantea]
MASSSSEEQPREQPEPEPESEPEPKPAGECVVLHKTKTVDFFGRSTPIILQNDNGPCPLLAICTPSLSLSCFLPSLGFRQDAPYELSALMGDNLLGEGWKQGPCGALPNTPGNVLLLKNQLNLSPDISEVSQEKLLSLVADRLIDSNSNVKDHETAEAIGSKSYNTIMSDLVSLETCDMKDEGKDRLDEDCIDFAAATAATLGVPSPNLSRAKSFDGSPRSISNQKIFRKGDAQEEAELQRVFKLSENEASRMGDDSRAAIAFGGESTMDPDKDDYHSKTTPEHPLHVSEGYSCNGSLDTEPSFGDVPRDCKRNVLSQEEKAVSLNLGDIGEGHSDELTAVESEESSLPNDLAKCRVDTSMVDKATTSSSPAKDTVLDQAVESLSTSLADSIDELDKQNGDAGHGDSQLSNGRRGGVEAIDSFNSSLDGNEPIYEGEECIQDLGGPVCDREPVYEGEMVLAELADKGAKDVSGVRSNNEITLRQGRNCTFGYVSLNNCVCSLFSLQEGLNERELCVFFRNNHFSTMFKFKGELYLLATDQGFMNQPDLVWEKLNEVNGDTLFVTSNFKEFRLESSANGIWDERNAVAITAVCREDYLASIDNSGQASSNLNSDLQLAIALQQQEFEQQQSQRHATQQPSSNGSSRLITGPQVSRAFMTFLKPFEADRLDLSLISSVLKPRISLRLEIGRLLCPVNVMNALSALKPREAAAKQHPHQQGKSKNQKTSLPIVNSCEDWLLAGGV